MLMFSKSRVYVFIEDRLRFTWTVYIAYLPFQFWSHKHLYRDTKLKSSRLLIKTPVNSHYLTEMLSTSMTMNDKRGSMHDDQSSAPSSRRVSMISSNFPISLRCPDLPTGTHR